jgi:hypothetical protein
MDASLERMLLPLVDTDKMLSSSLQMAVFPSSLNAVLSFAFIGLRGSGETKRQAPLAAGSA